MDFWNNLSSNERAIALVVGLLMVVGLTEGNPGFALLMLVLAGLFIVRQQGEEQRERQTREAEPYIEREIVRRERRPASNETSHDHALQAVQRAGRDPYRAQVLPVDLGLLAFRGDDEPVIHRTYPVADDSDYVQPFVQLRVPEAVVGSVRFELLDEYGELAFVHEEEYALQRGRNLVIPSTRMPVHDERLTVGRWEMRVLAGGMVLASHLFSWENSDDDEFRRHLGEDGEISSSMRAVLAENRLGDMSLDDLLSDQDEDMSTPPDAAHRASQ